MSLLLAVFGQSIDGQVELREGGECLYHASQSVMLSLRLDAAPALPRSLVSCLRVGPVQDQ